MLGAGDLQIFAVPVFRVQIQILSLFSPDAGLLSRLRRVARVSVRADYHRGAAGGGVVGGAAAGGR